MRLPNGTLEVVAALLVLFSALWDPRVSLGLAVLTLASLGAWRLYVSFLQKTAIGNGGAEGGGTVLNSTNQARMQAKEEHVAAVLAEARKRGSITNAQVQKLLGVGDSTAERYLQELEQAGELRQVGTTGQAVSYIPTS